MWPDLVAGIARLPRRRAAKRRFQCVHHETFRLVASAP